MADEAARRAVAELPLLRTAAGPRDRESWASRLKEEYRALIQYVENNKRADNDWFRLESNAEGTRWVSGAGLGFPRPGAAPGVRGRGRGEPGLRRGGGRAPPVCCRWFGKCWYVHELLKYEFAIEFDVSGEGVGGGGRGAGGARGAADPRPCHVPSPPQIPVTYPSTAPEIAIPELDGKTAKMYRWEGGWGGPARGWSWAGGGGPRGADGSLLPAGGARSASATTSSPSGPGTSPNLAWPI
uniref:Ubiquitin-fold modifier-conjugating enzyme 1 n=1 Tax=Aquila chrysaetos chrysaetos TaxID=223781 RepID=A0A663ELZ1_AQUCH